MNAQSETRVYINIWLILIACTLVSVGLTSIFGHGLILVILIFSIAAMKAALVASYFMHLKFEPLIVWIAVLSGLAVVVLVLVGLIPDIVYQFGRITS